MKLLRLLQADSFHLLGQCILAACLSGLGNCAILVMVNAAAQSLTGHPLHRWLVWGFLLALIPYVFGLRYTYEKVTFAFESAICDVRVRIAHKIQAAPLQALEQLGEAKIQHRLTEEMAVISRAAGPLTTALQDFFLLGFTGLYMASLSPAAFLIWVASFISGIVYYQRQIQKTEPVLTESSQRQVERFQLLEDLLGGFKQVKLNRRLGDELLRDLNQVSSLATALTMDRARRLHKTYLTSRSLLYLSMAMIVLVLPRFIRTDGAVLYELTAILLFTFRPLASIVECLPPIAAATHAAENIAALEQSLPAEEEPSAPLESSAEPGTPGPIQEISLEGAEFSYCDTNQQALFSVGPLHLTISSGERLFIVGGNGSGKSTLLKLLLALYAPNQGCLRLGQAPVTPKTVQRYRELFSAVFADFHLFEKLYGLKTTSTAEVQRLLKVLGLQGKLRFDGRQFSTLQLSTGERKRLALLVALLEDRPVYVFDEWSAHQEPEFRLYFYEDLLPDLKLRGKTVIVVTHDDRFFHLGDRLLKMDYGRIERIEPAPAAGHPA